MRPSEREYLLARAAAERVIAAEASDETVRQIHASLAQKYELRAKLGNMTIRAANDAFRITPVGDQSS